MPDSKKGIESFLHYYGSLIGALLGGIITMLVMFITIRSERKNNQQIIKRYDRQYESQYLPVFDVHLLDANNEKVKSITLNGEKNKYVSVKVVLENISDNSALNVLVEQPDPTTFKWKGNLRKGEELIVNTNGIPTSISEPNVYKIYIVFTSVSGQDYNIELKFVTEENNSILSVSENDLDTKISLLYPGMPKKNNIDIETVIWD